jgi:hypothetical protein
MATVDLDTPFRKGEKVVATRDLFDVPGGAKGKVMLSNGLGVWRRYWVRFEDGRQMGQISHDDLVRPKMIDAWKARKEEQALAAERAANQAEESAAAVTAGDSGGNAGGGLAAQIPAHLLERSKAAKARLLG